MAFVPVDGATEFAVGAVAKSAPLLQTDLNVDQLAETMNEGIAESSEDFETGDFSANPWVVFQPDPWIVSNVTPHAGTYSMKSGPNPASTTSAIQVTKPVSDGTFSFWYKIDTGVNAELIFRINGITQLATSVNVGWTQLTVPVSAGTHTFTWVFIQRTAFGGSDAVWVDDILFPGQVAGGISDLHRHTGGNGGKPVRRWPMNPHGKGFGSGSTLSKTHGLWRLYSNIFYRTIDTFGSTIEEVAQVSDGFWIPNGVDKLNMLSKNARPPSGTSISTAIGLALYSSTIANPYDINHYTNKTPFQYLVLAPFDRVLTIDNSLKGQFCRLAVLLRVRTTNGIATFQTWNTIGLEHEHRFLI